jgi:hypothetical protein
MPWALAPYGHLKEKKSPGAASLLRRTDYVRARSRKTTERTSISAFVMAMTQR